MISNNPRKVAALVLSLGGITLGCLTPVLFCCLLAVLPMLLNNLALARFANNLFNYPLPPNTLIEARKAEVGRTGNGNHCDFVAEVSLSSTLTKAEIESYYRDVSLPPAGQDDPTPREPVPVYVDFDGTPATNGRTLFTIRIWDGEYPPGLDFRCH